MNRKLIRPKLAEVQTRNPVTTTTRELVDMSVAGTSRRKQIPPEQTNAENFYYIKQMSAKTAVVVVMEDGEELLGVIEWYDRDCLKINRNNGPNMVVMKRYIKFIYKERERR